MKKYLCVAILAVGGLLGTGCDSTTTNNTPDSGTPTDSGTPDSSVDAGPACATATNPLNKCTNNSCVPFDNKAHLPLLLSDGGVPALP